MPLILSVEDDPDFQALISSALNGQGYEVRFAYTGPEGHAMALSLHPDLILLDMMLPGLSGREIITLLKSNEATSRIPIIVLTAFPNDAGFFENDIKSLGAAVYMRKPVHLAALTGAIRGLLAV